MLLYSALRPRAMSPSAVSMFNGASSSGREKKFDRESATRGESCIQLSLMDQCSVPHIEINGLEMLEEGKEGSSILLLDSDVSLLSNCIDKQKGEGMERSTGGSVYLDEFHHSPLGIKEIRGMKRDTGTGRGRGALSEKGMPSKMENTGNKSYTDRNVTDLWRIAQLEHVKDKAKESMRPHSAMERGSWVRSTGFSLFPSTLVFFFSSASSSSSNVPIHPKFCFSPLLSPTNSFHFPLYLHLMLSTRR